MPTRPRSTNASPSAFARSGVILALSATILAAGTAMGVASRPASVEGEHVRVDQPTQPSESMQEKIGFARALSDAFKHAAAQISPSVVRINTIDVRRVQRTDSSGRRIGDPIEQQREAGLGSGVIIDDGGFIVTNAHVVNGAERFVVTLYDGREVDAELVGADPSSDIAVLRADVPGLTSAAWGDSEAAEVGEWVIAVGSPFGLERTVTAGIISSKGRSAGEVERNSRADARFQEFIQTDAAVNPGNSGGPLVDLDGRILGINTAIATRSGGSNGLSFAVPADLARAVAESIIEDGSVRRGYLGIRLAEIDAQTAYELAIPGGVSITLVEPDGPAAVAGLRAGDIIISVNGRSTETDSRLRNAIGIVRPGEIAEIQFIRDSQRLVRSVEVADRLLSQAIELGGGRIETLGVTVQPEQLVVRRGRRVINRENGLRIIQIDANSPAGNAGLSLNDVILEVNSERTETLESLREAIESSSLENGYDIRLFNGRMVGEIFVGDL